LLDPYDTLGVARDCTREEAVAAFRDKVWLAHPDKGGDEQAFIELCSAYQTVLKDARPKKRGRRLAPAARVPRPPERPAPEATSFANRPRKPDRKVREPKSPDANWEPDLILSADIGRNGQPAPAADPTWEPDLIVADEAASERRVSPPPDPNWEPGFVLKDESPDDETGVEPAGSPGSPAAYRSLFQRISAGPPHDADQGLVAGLTQVFRAFLVLIFVAWVVGTIWLCKIMWEESNDASGEATRTHSLKTPRSS
jgi:DnaJ domain